jgi:hypothetical protein
VKSTQRWMGSGSGCHTSGDVPEGCRKLSIFSPRFSGR